MNKVYQLIIGAWISCCVFACGNSGKVTGAAAVEKPLVAFVVGDLTQGAQQSMELMAQILDSLHNVETLMIPIGQQLNPETENSDTVKLSGLHTADLAVFFLEDQQIPEAQLNHILNYVNLGKPIMGFRTSTHAFDFDSTDLKTWNDGFGLKVFGQKWLSDNGVGTETNARIFEGAKDHPIMRGVSLKFSVPSSLYNVTPLLGDCRQLVKGRPVKIYRSGKRKEYFGSKGTQPVVWTREYTGSKGEVSQVFFTTFGAFEDFEINEVRMIVVNAVYWLLGKEGQIPPTGCFAPMLESAISNE